ncbi:MAG TPA: amidohydrolase [Clostridia bacterium]|nr:amidohydrolase [Clostridia bacterium]
MKKEEVLQAIDENAALFTNISDEIWGYAELSLKEYRSADLYEKVLIEAGFTVEKGLYGIDTAVVGSYGQGKPVIGILGEYDALSGLSQQGGVAERAKVPGMECGHGCGHNLLGAGAFAAAYAVKNYLEKSGKPGTVIFYGCPGEEGGASKAFFAKQNEWYKLDAALSWHPDDVNQVSTGSCMACIQTEYLFTGIASHAAGAPEHGRSALDAVELMNIGVQYLREHINKTASVHYAITDAGGLSPNVVQSAVKVLYMVREADVHRTLALQARVDKIADAAAMMTETTLTKRFIDGTSNTVPNRALETLLYNNFQALGVPSYTEEELSFMEALKETYSSHVFGLPGVAAMRDPSLAQVIEQLTDNGKRVLNNFLMPQYFGTETMPGSTDVGDVSWQTPTAQINTVAFPSLCPGHSWQNVAAGKSSVAHKGMLHAGKVMAASAIDIINEPNLLDSARLEFQARTKKGFVSPIPDGAKPEIV